MIYLEILLGQIPEAVYYSLFFIFAKDLKGNKNVLFTLLMILSYIIIEKLTGVTYLFTLFYCIGTYFITKLIYKDKSNIIDIFLFIFSFLFIGTINIPCLFLNLIIKNIYFVCILSKIICFILIFLLRNKIRKFYLKFGSLWNRNDFINDSRVY